MFGFLIEIQSFPQLFQRKNSLKLKKKFKLFISY